MATDSPAIVERDDAGRDTQVESRARGARRHRLRERIAPSLALLPILAFYTLVQLGVHTAHNDEPAYLAYAHNLPHMLESQMYHRFDFLWHGPAFPALLAPLVALHVPLALTRFVFGPLLLFATLSIFHALVRGLVPSKRAALIATYVLVAYLPFFTAVGHLHVEVLAALCIMIAAAFMLRAFRGGRRDHVWAGVALAVLALSRVEFGYVLMVGLALSLVWLVLRRGSMLARKSAWAAAIALVLCIPWLLYTHQVSGRAVYWGDAGGLQLYWMTAPNNVGDWHNNHEAFSYPQLAAEGRVLTQLRNLTPAQRDARLEHIAVQNIKAHPKHYLTNVVFNVGRLLFNSPYSYGNLTATGTSPGWGLMFYALPNAILIGLLTLAAVVAVRIRRRVDRHLVPLALFVGLAFAIHLPVAAYGRLVMPLVPLAAWIALAIVAPNVRLVAPSEEPRQWLLADS